MLGCFPVGGFGAGCCACAGVETPAANSAEAATKDEPLNRRSRRLRPSLLGAISLASSPRVGSLLIRRSLSVRVWHAFEVAWLIEVRARGMCGRTKLATSCLGLRPRKLIRGSRHKLLTKIKTAVNSSDVQWCAYSPSGEPRVHKIERSGILLCRTRYQRSAFNHSQCVN